jgi:hypothetical protein
MLDKKRELEEKETSKLKKKKINKNDKFKNLINKNLYVDKTNFIITLEEVYL